MYQKRQNGRNEKADANEDESVLKSQGVRLRSDHLFQIPNWQAVALNVGKTRFRQQRSRTAQELTRLVVGEGLRPGEVAGVGFEPPNMTAELASPAPRCN